MKTWRPALFALALLPLVVVVVRRSGARVEAVTPSAHLQAGAPSVAPTARASLDRAARSRLIGQLSAARDRRQARASMTARDENGVGAQLVTPAPLDAEYVKAQLDQLVPAVTACYERAHLESPALTDELVVDVTIVGEPGVGGYVESSDVLAQRPPIANDGLVDCVRETMLIAELAAPPNGGEASIRYPFTFHRGDRTEP